VSLPVLTQTSNLIKIEYNNLTVWFSFGIPIAFQVGDFCPPVVRQNEWSNATTGRHLNMIDGGNKSNRVSADKFEELWEKWGYR
jgi:hypothetical protein